MDATDLCYLSAVEQKALLDNKEISTVELIDAHAERIERINPKINAFVTLRLDGARDDAKAADAARAKGGDLGVLHGLPSPFEATRYHSLVVERETLPEALEITAEAPTADGRELIMALQHRSLPVYGVQFHPESIASEHGHRLLANFLGLTQRRKAA